MKPPYSITPTILEFISSISEKIGAINAAHLQIPRAELRKSNRIKTIQSSLEIEGNTLSIEQVTAILDNKRVLAPKKDILEVLNAIDLYDQIDKLNATSIASFLKAHAILMKGLSPSAGKIRSSSVGIVKGMQLTHLAPPAKMVKSLLNILFNYLKKDKDPVLIKSCVFHYELEFIHPFSDGNGRMGRLWQTVLLQKYNPVFSFLPIETIIKKRQSDYYKALSISDKAGNSTTFIEFLLSVIDHALEDLLHLQQPPLSAFDRIVLFKTLIGKTKFTRQDYMLHFKEISSATASRDLKDAVEKKILKREGDKRTTVYHYY
ncbi:MAG: Fic family protein [Chitinophagaceae bacterium]|nr:Fic family protein [Chitinophagaceae bacterium]